MYEQLLELIGDPAATIIYYGLIAIAIVIALWILRIVWNRIRQTPFIANASHRKHRLAIIDATPVDNRRRLVLVRRDEVEHLILIGGMNDILIESNIKHRSEMVSNEQDVKSTKTPPSLPTKVPEPPREPAAPTPQVQTAPEPRATPKPLPASVTQRPAEPVRRPEPIEPRAQQIEQRPIQSRPTPPMTPATPATLAATAPAPRPAVETPKAPTTSLDDDLDMDMDFEITPDQLKPHSAPSVEHAPKQAQAAPSRKIDDEMEELLNQLSGDKKP